MEKQYNILDIIKEEVHKTLYQRIMQPITKERLKILNFIRQYAEKEMRNLLAEVYTINAKRVEGSIPLEELISAVCTEIVGSWGVSVYIDDRLVNIHTVKGDPVYKIRRDNNFQHLSKEIVTTVDEQWQEGIGTIREDDWMRDKIWIRLDNFVRTQVSQYIISKIIK